MFSVISDIFCVNQGAQCARNAIQRAERQQTKGIALKRLASAIYGIFSTNRNR
jgi:hypothetical protein